MDLLNDTNGYLYMSAKLVQVKDHVDINNVEQNLTVLSPPANLTHGERLLLPGTQIGCSLPATAWHADRL